MSDSERSSWSGFGSEDPQWLCLVTLFLASLVTLALYFAQYFQLGLAGRRLGAVEDDGAAREQEAAALLTWALSLGSWRRQWREAWCKALNDEASRSRVSPTDTCFYLQATPGKKGLMINMSS